MFVHALHQSADAGAVVSTSMTSALPSMLTLTDGRRLGYYAYGAPTGVPCIYIPGTPVSGLGGADYDAPARTAGVRWISVDKPGYGVSDPHPGNTLLAFAHDIAALADHLGFGTFAVAGESGGGPYALATAYALGDRITVAVLLAGMGPGHEPWARQGMKPLNRALVWLAQRAPIAVWPVMRLMAWIAADEQRLTRQAQREAKHLPPADRAYQADFGHLERAAVRDAFRQGVGGSVTEARILASEWGFDVADINTPVEMWHGTADVNVPIALAQHLASRLPLGTLHTLDGVGHAAGHIAAVDVVRAVARS